MLCKNQETLAYKYNPPEHLSLAIGEKLLKTAHTQSSPYNLYLLLGPNS